MKFGAFFGLQNAKSLDDIKSFLTNEFGRMMNDLSVGLKTLSFVDNFKSFKETVTISPNQEVKIKNKLSPKIPSMRVIVRGTTLIADGPTEWSQDYVYIKNYGATEVEATIIFME